MSAASSPRRLIRAPRLMDLMGQGLTGTYAQIKAGLLPPQIKLGRTSVWVEDEVAAVIAARIAGRSDEELRSLVQQLVAARKEAS